MCDEVRCSSPQIMVITWLLIVIKGSCGQASSCPPLGFGFAQVIGVTQTPYKMCYNDSVGIDTIIQRHRTGGMMREKQRGVVMLDELRHRAYKREWRGKGGLTDRDLYLSLMEGARDHGSGCDEGRRISISDTER